MNDTTTITDQAALARAREVLGEDPPSALDGRLQETPPPPGRTASVPRWTAIAATVLGMVLVVSVAKLAWVTQPVSTTVNARIAQPATTTPPAPDVPPAPLIPAASLLGAPAGGMSNGHYGLTAWPGAVLIAPQVTTGKATAWAWQTCTGKPPTGCANVAGVTESRWSAPTSTKPLYVRAIVTVELSQDTSLRVASAPVLVLPWPEGKTPKGAAPK